MKLAKIRAERIRAKSQPMDALHAPVVSSREEMFAELRRIGKVGKVGPVRHAAHPDAAKYAAWYLATMRCVGHVDEKWPCGECALWAGSAIASLVGVPSQEPEHGEVPKKSRPKSREKPRPKSRPKSRGKGGG